eukprot:4410168-Prymnesium_polylepis.1
MYFEQSFEVEVTTLDSSGVGTGNGVASTSPSTLGAFAVPRMCHRQPAGRPSRPRACEEKENLLRCATQKRKKRKAKTHSTGPSHVVPHH